MLQERFGLEVITTREASKVLQQAFPNCITERSTYVLGVWHIPIPNPSVPHLVATVSADSVSFPLLLVISCVKFHYMVADGTKIMHAHTGIMLTHGECQTSFKSCSLGARACTTPKICCLSFYPWPATATTSVVGHTSSQRSKQSSATGVIFDGSNSSELQSLAPDLLKLFTTLGNTRRNMVDGVQGVVPNDIKALVSICTLLNCRLQRSIGYRGVKACSYSWVSCSLLEVFTSR